MSRIKALLVAFGLAALFSAVGVGVVLAEDGDNDGKQSHGVTEEEKQTYHEARLAGFAQALGVSVEELRAAFQQVALDHVDAAEEDGAITAEKATALRTAIEAGELAGKRFGRGFRDTDSEGGSALAEELGVTVEDLTAARKQVALERVAEAVAAGKLSEEEGTEIRAKIESGEGLDRDRGHHGFEKRGGKSWHGDHDKDSSDHDNDSDTEEPATAE